MKPQNNSPDIPLKAVKGLISAIDDVKHGRYTITTNSPKTASRLEDKEPEVTSSKNTKCFPSSGSDNHNSQKTAIRNEELIKLKVGNELADAVDKQVFKDV